MGLGALRLWRAWQDVTLLHLASKEGGPAVPWPPQRVVKGFFIRSLHDHAMTDARRSLMQRTWALAAAVATVSLALGALPAQAGDTTAGAQLAQWQAQAGAPASAERGKVFFAARHGGELSCASCHGAPPTAPARHASTGKAIDTLAPAFNPARFTDTAKVRKWFTRNCKDVLSRECSAAEKADLLAYLTSLKP